MNTPLWVAQVVIKDAAKMTAKGRKELAKWLRAHADNLVKMGDKYSPRFTGRYFKE